MKFKVDICGTSVLLDYKQLSAFIKAIDGAECVEDKYVGNSQGHNGTNYVRLIRPLSLMDTFRFYAMSDDEYGALQLVTKLENEKK